MIIIALVISIFFIVVISMLLRAYTKDIKELEDRILVLEKRICKCEKDKSYLNWIFDPVEHGFNITGESFTNPKKKEGEEMPCGRRGRPVGRRTTSRGKGKRK